MPSEALGPLPNPPSSARMSVPEQTKFRLLYRNADRCCVCRARSVQIHHIDKNRDNNDEANLAVVCLTHHDAAHTQHQLSQNLTPDRIRDAKSRWEAEVAEAITKGMLPVAIQEQAVWTYINHDRLPGVLRAHGVTYDEAELQDLIAGGIVNKLGVPLPVIEPENGPDELITLYDRIPYEYRARLLELYSDGIANLIRIAGPVDFRQMTNSPQLQAMVQQGTICFLLAGFRFYSNPTRPDRSQIRQVYTNIAGTAVEFLIDTRFMFGISSLTSSYVGHRQAAALLLVKSINFENDDATLHCTPLALGTGFLNRRSAWSGPECD